MADLLCREFQDNVSKHLARHRSVLDVVSKLQESASRTNRAVAKAVTTCGCIRVNASKQQVPETADYSSIASHMRTHVEGELCDTCREALEGELGRQLLYLAGLCEIMGLDLVDVMLKEQNRLNTLGRFYCC